MTEYVEVLELAELSVGSAKIVKVKRKKIALFNVDGELFAIDNSCSHGQASLAKGHVEDCTVSCPLHGAKFDLRTGRNLSLPAIVPVKKYEVKVEHDKIYIAV